MHNQENVEIELFPGKVVSATKKVFTDATVHYVNHPISPFELKNVYVKDLTKLGLNTELDISNMTDYHFKQFEQAKIFNYDNGYCLTLDLAVRRSEWKEAFDLNFFPELISRELKKLGTKLRKNETYGDDAGYLDHWFIFQLTNDSDLHSQIQSCMKAYKEAFYNAFITANNHDVKIVQKDSVTSNHALVELLCPPVVQSWLSSSKLNLKLIGILTIAMAAVTAIVGILADFKEVFS